SLWGTSFTRNDTTVYGRRGTLWLAGGKIVLHSPGAPVPGAIPVEWQGFSDCYHVPPDPALPEESILHHFVNCILAGPEPTSSRAMQLHVHEILFRAYQPAETGETQELRTTFTPWHPLEPGFYDTRSGFV